MTEETCSLCDGARYNRGWCRRHYNRWWRWGDPEYVHQRPTLDERFWAKVNKTEGCWLWTGYSTSGYGYLRWGPQENQQFEGAHRYAYTKLRGPIPEGLVLDHLCRTPLCVNPDHLEVVTNAVNVLRGMSPPARNARKTHCKRGHEFTAENTRWSSRGHRSCKSCDRDAAREKLRAQGRMPASAATASAFVSAYEANPGASMKVIAEALGWSVGYTRHVRLQVYGPALKMSDQQCLEEGCEVKAICRRRCRNHYVRHMRKLKNDAAGEPTTARDVA